jgi:quercetin dioxygenase-like cupin family protein
MKVNHGREAGAPSEERGPTFTGTVWADPVLVTGEGALVNTVIFPPRSRTHWHTHEIGQILQVVNGRGYIQVRGGEGSVLSAGDTVWIPAGEEHWHGGLPDSFLTHTAISLGMTDWLDEVREEDYDASVSGA